MSLIASAYCLPLSILQSHITLHTFAGNDGSVLRPPDWAQGGAERPELRQRRVARAREAEDGQREGPKLQRESIPAWQRGKCQSGIKAVQITYCTSQAAVEVAACFKALHNPNQKIPLVCMSLSDYLWNVTQGGTIALILNIQRLSEDESHYF